MTTIQESSFGYTKDRRKISLFTLQNATRTKVCITNLGCAIVSIFLPDRSGVIDDVVLGYDSGEEYENQIAYFGVILGRCANRIRGGQFYIGSKLYSLSLGADGNHAHGGKIGFDRRLWDASCEGGQLVLRYRSPDGEEGYPGNLDTTVTYELRDDNSLVVRYQAVSDQDTVVNLSNHSYFNLAGHAQQKACEQYFRVAAHRYTEFDTQMIPTGEIGDVNGTALDFTVSTRIQDRISEPQRELKIGGGYDLNYVLDKPDGKLGFAAELYDPKSGRTMKILTTYPGLQFYSGNGFPFEIKGKNAVWYKDRSGICLETQFFPDSVHHAWFPETRLSSGAQYDQTTIYQFGVR